MYMSKIKNLKFLKKPSLTTLEYDKFHSPYSVEPDRVTPCSTGHSLLSPYHLEFFNSDVHISRYGIRGLTTQECKHIPKIPFSECF